MITSTTGLFIMNFIGWSLFLFGVDLIKREKSNSWQYFVGKLLTMFGLIVEMTLFAKIL